MADKVIDPNALIMGTGARSATFKEHKDEVWGTIMSSEVRQQTDAATKALKFYDDGNPMLQVAIILLTELHEDEDDDGLRAVYAKGQMLKAIRAAVMKVRAKGIEDGGKLFVRYVGDEAPKSKGLSGAKQYIAKYEPHTRMTELPHSDNDEDPAEPF